MKVIIFIGQHKTGSTSLQMYMSRNYKALRRAGILYPMIMPDDRPLKAKLLDWYPGDKPLLPLNQREPHNALALRLMSDETGAELPPWHRNVGQTQDLFDYMNKEIKRHNPHTVFLISEIMANLAACNPSLIQKIKEAFSGHDVKIIATLRYPDAYIASWHGQRLRFGDHSSPLREHGLDQYVNTVHLDYKLMLQGWRDVFRDAEFQFTDYAEVSKRGGSIEAFKQDSGIEFPKGLVGVPRSNRSVPLAFREIIRHGNKELPRPAATRFLNWSVNHMDDIERVPDRNIEMFGSENRARLMEFFSPVHDYLSEITGKAPFFPNIDKVLITRDVSELEAARQGLESLRQFAKDSPPGPRIMEFLNTFELPPNVN